MVNLYYNKDQFQALLDSFNKEVSEKKFTRISYDAWRRLSKASNAVIMKDEKTVIVIPDTGASESYPTNDRSFGEFFSKYYSTRKTVNKHKENNTMKMPTMNFDFGPFTEPGVVALSPYGIAVRSSKGEYLTYNATTGATVDVTGFTFDFQKMIYKMPVAIKDLRAGDMVLHRNKPMYVQSIEEDGIHCIDILASEAKVVVPVTNMFGFNFVTKVVSLMNFNAAQPSADNPFGNLMPFMMMSSIMGDDSDNDFSKMMMMSMMMGGSNPFTAMFTPQDK